MRTILLMLALVGLLARPSWAQLGNVPDRTGRDCTVCHLEWIDTFNQTGAVLLIDAPGKATVAEADSCLDCHDGSIADSRKAVWLEHSHSVGLAPSPGMKVPREFPLDGGKLSCRTCHTAHTNGFNESLKDAVFLRVRNEQDQLCRACHGDKAQGPQFGTHSLGPMKTVLPSALLAAGAHGGPKNDTVLCQSCHLAHGGRDDKLLLMPTSASELCITCHQTMRPAMWDTDPTHNHPQNPPIHKPEQIEAIKQMKTLLGSDNRLVCLSCHKMHDAQPGKAILADTLRDSALCIRCHSEKKPMIGSEHDLRKSGPTERNTRDETIAESGFCGACHTFHSLTRKPLPAPGDPQGLCSTCHSPGQVAAKHVGTMFHPVNLPDKQMTCLTCHDAHDPKHSQFLRADREQVCADCHKTLAESLSKPHDFSGRNDVRNALGSSPSESGRCGFCHSMHQAKGPMMLAATNQPVKTMDDACGQCHRPEGIAREHAIAKLNHPSGPEAKAKDAAQVKLPLFAGSVACGSCHDVHGNQKQSKALLRAASATSLCVTCHSKEGNMVGNAHDPVTQKKSGDLCLSCHQAHSNDRQKQLWTIAMIPNQAGFDGVCAACHVDQSWSERPKADHTGATLHPHVIAVGSEISKTHRGLPLAADSSTILCKTCHDPHAPPKTVSLLRISASDQSSAVCAKCHIEAEQLKTSMHSPDHVGTQDARAQACAPCHRVHATEGMGRNRLWATTMFEKGKDASERYCLGCHSAGGGAAAPAVFSHPETNMKDVKAATAQPSALIDQFGKISQITCSTCHMAHGCDMPKPASDPADIASMKTMLRPNVASEVCAACHGIDGARRFLYFHDPKKRTAVTTADSPH